MRIYKALTLVVLVCLPGFIYAQSRKLSGPEQFLGYPLGSHFTPHYKVVEYFQYVASNSPEVSLEQYGETNEGRPLMIARVSTQANQDRLGDIRKSNLDLSGLMNGNPDPNQPAIVWLSYNVHGNEAVSTEASMQVLYDLVSGNNKKYQDWLKNTVVIIDPCLNPDGRQRYVAWYNQIVGDTPNPSYDAREHHEPWPGGRVNHYYFDLNRDWAWMVQKESRERVAIYQKWMPQIHVDFHEMGPSAPYYFAPAAIPFHEAITGWQRKFQEIVGENNAHYFDQHGWLYFTRQVYDLFYPSYGDTYPIFNGAIGMTYEQGGGGVAGLALKRAVEDTLTLTDRIAHHWTTSISTIEAASEHHDELLSNYKQYFQKARTNPEGTYKTYLVKASNNPDKLKELTDLLNKEQITYGFATKKQTVRGFHYQANKEERTEIQPGDLLVSAYQTKGVLTRVLFEPKSTLTDSLTYDITAWALPYVYGVDSYALSERIEPGQGTLPNHAYQSIDSKQPYAYVAKWNSFEDLKMLSKLIDNGVKIRYSEKSFSINGRTYPIGTLLILRKDNRHLGNQFETLVNDAAKKFDEPIQALTTGLTPSGPDFGSNDVRFIKKPTVAVLSGEGTSAYAVGAVWHFMDRQINYPVTLIGANYFNRIDLGKYNVLILPDGRYGDVFRKKDLDKIHQWIRNGGKLIAMEGAIKYLSSHASFVAIKEKKSTDPSKGKEDSHEKLQTYANRERDEATNINAGSIYRVHMDNTHPLAFGYGDTYFSLKLDADSYDYLEDGWNVGVVEGDALVSGFTGYNARKKLMNSLDFGIQPIGRGEIVYMVDNPLFRGFWMNGKLLFGNALFMVGQ